MADDTRFDWDEANIGHIARHSVTQEEVEEVFLNDQMDIDFEIVNGEDRWTGIGHTNAFRVLMVVWTMRGDRIRPITARLAAKGYRDAYLETKREN